MTAPVEIQPDTGHAAPVLAKKLVEAIDEYSTRERISFAELGRRVGLSRGYIDKMRAAVAADPEHTIDTRTLERIAAAIGYVVRLEPVERRRGS